MPPEPGAATEDASGSRVGPAWRWLPLGLLSIAMFIEIAGSTSVFTAGPDIQKSLGLSAIQLQWMFTAATLPAGALLLVGGRLADRYGARRTFLAGAALLALSSLAAGLASSSVLLLLARVGQGVSGAVLLPAALSLVMTTYPEGSERVSALTAWSAIGGVGATAGLLLGGVVTEGLGWPWVFWVNVPVCLLVIVAAPLVLAGGTHTGSSQPADVLGSVLVTAGLAALILGVGRVAEQGGVDASAAGLGLLGLLLLVGFAVAEARSVHPMLPARLLAIPNVRGGTLLLFVTGMTVDGLLFTLTGFTQTTLGYPPGGFGLLTAVMTVTSVVAAYLARRAVGRLGLRVVALLGVCLLLATGLSLAGFARWGAPVLALVAAMVAFGLGMGAAFLTGSIASLDGVPAEDSGVAASVQNLSFTLGTTLGVAVAASAGALAVGPAADQGGSARGAAVAFLVAAAITAAGVLTVRRLGGRRPYPG